MYQAMQDIKDMVVQEWDDKKLRKPVVMFIYDEKAINVAWNDYVLIQGNSVVDDVFGLYGSNWKSDIYLTVEIRTSKGMAYAQSMLDEFRRIIRKNVRYKGYAVTRMGRVVDLSVETQKIWRMSIDVVLIKIS